MISPTSDFTYWQLTWYNYSWLLNTHYIGRGTKKETLSSYLQISFKLMASTRRNNLLCRENIMNFELPYKNHSKQWSAK